MFRATDTDADQAIALKVLAPDFPATDAEIQQFIKAMKPRLALTHPNLVTLRGVGKSGPYVWLAMELIEGDSAATAIEASWNTAGKVRWRPALRVALGLVHAAWRSTANIWSTAT